MFKDFEFKYFDKLYSLEITYWYFTIHSKAVRILLVKGYYYCKILANKKLTHLRTKDSSGEVTYFILFPQLIVIDECSSRKTREMFAGVDFTNILREVFYARRSQKRKKDSQVTSVFLRFWDLHVQKLLVKCWWNQPQEITHCN